MTPSIKRDAASGLVVLAPLLVTAYTLWWLVQTVASTPLVDRLAPHVPLLRQLGPTTATVILTLAVVLALLVAVSWIMRSALGAVFESKLDASVNQVPGFRVVYNASKIAVETAVDENVELQAPAKLHLWNDARLTAWRTGREASDGRVTVYVPASPVIFTGFVIEVDEDRVLPTDESTEDALIRVLSAGFADRTGEGGDDPAQIGAAVDGGTSTDDDHVGA